MAVKEIATTVDGYIAALPAERAAVVRAALEFVRGHIPRGYVEEIGYGMICWNVPLSVFPDTYNGQPLCAVALASQKNHVALYLMSAYGDDESTRELAAAFAAAGKKLDFGKSCLRFKSLDDLALEPVAKIIAATPPAELIARHETVHGAKKKS
jgi:hypothetical protein